MGSSAAGRNLLSAVPSSHGDIAVNVYFIAIGCNPIKQCMFYIEKEVEKSNNDEKLTKCKAARYAVILIIEETWCF